MDEKDKEAMQEVQLLNPAPERDALYFSKKDAFIYLYKGRGGGGNGPKKYMFIRVASSIRGSERIWIPHEIMILSWWDNVVKITNEDLPLYLDIEYKYPEFYKRLKEA